MSEAHLQVRVGEVTRRGEHGALVRVLTVETQFVRFLSTNFVFVIVALVVCIRVGRRGSLRESTTGVLVGKVSAAAGVKFGATRSGTSGRTATAETRSPARSRGTGGRGRAVGSAMEGTTERVGRIMGGAGR